MKKIFLLFVLLILCPALLSAAERESISMEPDEIPPSRLDIYVGDVMAKFDFGAVNFLGGWTEVISEPADYAQKKSGRGRKVLAATAGLGEGVVDGLLNTVGGLANMLTAPLPQFRIPLPEKGLDVARLTAPAQAAAPSV